MRATEANNQWDIGAELGSDPMSSAFARVLTKGPKEVAMVLDKERRAKGVVDGKHPGS